MTGRIAARAIVVDYAARAQAAKTEREAFRDRVLELMQDGRERYSVEVAAELGVSIQRAYPLVAWALRSLEKQGALESRFAAAPGSGMGRRYYRLART